MSSIFGLLCVFLLIHGIENREKAVSLFKYFDILITSHMKTQDFIQLLELTPNLPLKVEYLPGKYTDNGFEVVSVRCISLNEMPDNGNNNNIQRETHLHIRESINKKPLFTTELLSIFLKMGEGENYYNGTSIKIKFENQELQASILDITEVELFQKTFTVKLFFTNHVPKAWKTSRQRKKNV